MSAEPSPALLRLAMGAKCTRCGATPDESCRTRKGRATTAHGARIDRAVSLHLFGRA